MDPAIWINKNQSLLCNYKCKYVAISDGIIAFGDHIQDVNSKAKSMNKEYVIYYVPKNVNQIKIYPIHIKSLSVHQWQPLYPVEVISLENESFVKEALIDSGTDITCIPHQLGLDLGFEKYSQELTLKASGVGGDIDFFQRQCQIKIDTHELNIPVAWIQNEEELEFIIGRAIVFEYFDITFKQAEERIVFNWRKGAKPL